MGFNGKTLGVRKLLATTVVFFLTVKKFALQVPVRILGDGLKKDVEMSHEKSQKRLRKIEEKSRHDKDIF